MVHGLQEIISSAFANTQIPGRPITGHRCDECNEVDRLLGGRTWQDVLTNFPEYCHDAFPLLTQDAQNYFLPAYMLVALEPNSGTQGVSLESAFEDGRLCPENFTPEQRAAVICWLNTYWREQGESAPPLELISRWQ
jgi:hypothetical protein